MAGKLTTQQIKAIVAKEKPDVEVEDDPVQEGTAMADNSSVQHDAPDLDYLVKKFLKPAEQGARRAQPAMDSSRATNASKIVRVRPAGSSATDEVGTGKRKVVVVSAKDESIVAEQG